MLNHNFFSSKTFRQHQINRYQLGRVMFTQYCVVDRDDHTRKHPHARARNTTAVALLLYYYCGK